jgi:acyl carrier protein
MAVIEDIREFVMESFYASADLGNDASLLDTGTMDSTGVLELIAFIEQRYGIQVGDREIVPENFDTVRRVAGYVQRKLSERIEPRPAAG